MRPRPAPGPGRALPRTVVGAAGPPEGSGCGPVRPGCGAWDQPVGAETGKGGCPSPLRVPEVPEANSRAVRRLSPGQSRLRGSLSSAEPFAQGGFSYWLSYLNRMEDRL